MHKYVASFAILLLLSGCASNKVWTKPYFTQQEFYRDNSQCMAMSQGAANPQMMYTGGNAFTSGFASGWNQGSAIGSTFTRNRIYNQCMYGMGWHLVDK